MFVDGGYTYVIARRQPSFGGNYDLAMYDLPDTDGQFALYDGLYAATTKRCALWSIDPSARTFAPLVDVPGTGDTCYPEIIDQPNHQYLVYNYTSPLDTDPPWGTALTTGDTLIYRHTLTFPSNVETSAAHACPAVRTHQFRLRHDKGDRIVEVTVRLNRGRVLKRRGHSIRTVTVTGIRPDDTVLIVTRSATGVIRRSRHSSVACSLTRSTTVTHRTRRSATRR